MVKFNRNRKQEGKKKLNPRNQIVFLCDGTGAHHTKLMRFLQENEPTEKFEFLFCGVSCQECKIKDFEHAEIVSDFYNPPRHVKALLRSCLKIVIVGLFDPGVVFYFLTHRSLLKKTVVAFHGGEFYSIRGNLSLKMKVYQLARRSIVARMRACYTFTPDDYEFAKKYYNLPSEHGYVELPWHYEINPNYASIPKPNDPYVILVGHNAHPEDHHIEILKELARFKEENIKIIAPLSYGPRNNQQLIIQTGKKLFGDKFIPLTEWIEPKQYQKMLQSVSVFVLGTDRQAGTFNTNLMLRLGSKVYLNSDTSVWSYFEKYCGCKLFDIKSIAKQSFKEFVDFSVEDRMENSKKMYSKLTPESCLKSWQRVTQKD